ncbi:hypothetical protein J5U22_00724 [Saccharolobus shibatae]|uniref:PIN domain-containing protein n=1 Tax=Saccharolobus shibatae TaxID=2286 RepID=A0A8F5BZI0_9CREN|nr:hypothetical protein [Saccharolobus shibatae]QXJ34178.1 hypothetical protein J5U22_00724 [Saccharolobus shibatae]
MEKVREIMEKFKLDFEDAIHFFLSQKIGKLISNDRDMQRIGARF